MAAKEDLILVYAQSEGQSCGSSQDMLSFVGVITLNNTVKHTYLNESSNDVPLVLISTADPAGCSPKYLLCIVFLYISRTPCPTKLQNIRNDQNYFELLVP